MKSKRRERQQRMRESNPRRGPRFEVRNERLFWRVYDRDTGDFVGERYPLQDTAERTVRQLNKTHKQMR